MSSSLAAMVRRRDLLIEFVVSDLKQKDAGTLLGPIWWLLDPLILMMMYWMLVLVLGRGGDREAFPIFLLCGLLPAKFIAGTPAASAGILFKRRSLIQAYPFPTVFLPLSNTLSNLVFFALAVPLLGVAGALLFDRQLGLHTSQLLLLIVPMTVLTAGLCMIAAVFGAMVRDLANVLRYAARLLTYASPVIYGPDRIRNMVADIGQDGRLGELIFTLYQSNPLAIAIVVIRGSVYSPEWVAWGWWAVLCAEAAVVYAVGYWIYRRYERRVVKFI